MTPKLRLPRTIHQRRLRRVLQALADARRALRQMTETADPEPNANNPHSDREIDDWVSAVVDAQAALWVVGQAHDLIASVTPPSCWARRRRRPGSTNLEDVNHAG